MKLHHLVMFLTLGVVLTGCGSSGTHMISEPGSETNGVAITGKVNGGQQPITGAKVYLYAAGTGSYASSPTSLLTGDGYVTSGSDGSFSITGDYTCPSAPGNMVYLLTVGGNPGNSAGQMNPNLVLMAALGACGKLSNSTTVIINEVTTAASAYALAPFMGYTENNPPAGTAINVGVPTSGPSCNSAGKWLSTGANTCDYIGLENAFETVNNLVNVSTGAALAGTSTAIAPQARLNTLADILAACVNSTGGSAHDGKGSNGGDSNCGTLFDDTLSSGAVAPTDTLQSILNLARNPGPSAAVNASLFGLLTANAPFQTPLTSAPNDWTLFITLSGGGVDEPTALGIDSAGDVWAVSYSGALSAFTPAGVPVFPSGITGYGLNENYGLAIDGNNNVWTANQEVPGILLGTVSKFANNGASLSGSQGFSAGGIYYPQALATDTDGSVWVANYGNSSVTHITSSGTPATGDCSAGNCGLFAASIEYPSAIAVDANHNAWVASDSTSKITKISPGGSPQFTPITCCIDADGLAIDANNNVWSANWSASSVSLVSSTGTVISSGYTGGGLDNPVGIAVDGSGTVWVANYRGGSITELAGAASATPGAALSPSTGFGTAANLVEPYAVAIDASGNLWISNFATESPAGQQGTLTEFVGLATPVNTPLVGPARVP